MASLASLCTEYVDLYSSKELWTKNLLNKLDCYFRMTIFIFKFLLVVSYKYLDCENYKIIVQIVNA